MRDIFEELFSAAPVDPIEAARRSMRPRLPRRFYQSAGIDAAEGRFCVMLDGRPARTPAHHALAAPARPLAEAIAAEWDAQAVQIDPAKMPLTRLANSIIDGVAPTPAPVAAEVAKYLGSDLLLYRADAPDALVERQARHWNPILAWARGALEAPFVVAVGVVHQPQPEVAIENARAAIPADPWRLGAVHAVTTSTGSALIALALRAGCLSVEDAWRAAHVDEDWNLEQWGRDELAAEIQALRFEEIRAAATVFAALA